MILGQSLSHPTRPVKILFLGQCLNYGYEGVGKTDTYTALVADSLRSRFPGQPFRFDLKYFHHPRGLKPLLQHRMLLTKPDIAVINAPAMFAASYWRVSLLYQLAPEIVDTARSFLSKIESRVNSNASQKHTLLDRTSAVLPPIKLDEYERLLEEGVEYCRSKGMCQPILMGPGRFNLDTIEDYANHSPEVWSSVNRMVLRLGKRLGVPVINAQETLAEHSGEVFIPNNHRWSHRGHEVVALEIQQVLAPEIIAIRARYNGSTGITAR